MSIFTGIVTDDGPVIDVTLMVTVPRQNAIRIASSGSHTHEIPITPVFSCDHSEQGIDGLFGRDVLSGAIFIYDGHRKSYTLSF
ncbi:MAG: hypothetical protein IT548_03550 [Alphaproteobacteria bacterium]|nr:hypothetical protein [Alphaproteobacteria bacterium]